MAVSCLQSCPLCLCSVALLMFSHAGVSSVLESKPDRAWLCCARSTFDMEIGLPPAQGSLQATGDSLHQRYFPAAPSAFGNPLFTPAAPTQHPDMRAPWPSLNQGANSNSPFGVPYTHPAPHFSPHPSSNFHWGEAWALNRVQTPQVPTMAHMHQRDQSQTSVVGMTQPQLEQDGFRHLPKPFG